MAQARNNKGAPKLSDAQKEQGRKAFYDWHWFQGSEQEAPEMKIVHVQDPDVPDMLVECGRLVRLHVRAPSRDNPKHPRRERDTMIEFSRAVSAASHVAYDPNHPDDRIYLLVSPKARQALADRFWDENPLRAMDLNELASLGGGRHGKRADYPSVQVKPVGITTAVVYFTNKKEDGPSYYIHKLGELSHHYPILACDDLGRLWFAGGNYTAPTPGITD
jgi:hypothetical protein